MPDLDKYFKCTFKPGGRGERNAYDCYGLVQRLFKDFYGIIIDDYSGYDIRNSKQIRGLIEEGAENWHRVEGEPAKFGDVVVLIQRGVPRHMGFMLDSKRFIHVSERRNVSIERIDSMHRLRQVTSFYRHRELMQHGNKSSIQTRTVS